MSLKPNQEAVFCKNITKIFGEGTTRVDALRGVNLTLNKGELLMIVGPSGSGKTTLVSIIAGILQQSDGECRVLGQDINNMENSTLTHFRGKNIGFVFQVFNLVPMLNIQENVAVPLILNGVPYEEALIQAKELLIHFGLEDKIDQYPPSLSGGQQQRVAIARSSIHNPELIVCDEPTSSLDQETGAMVMELFRQEVLQKNRALIIVTHDPRIFSYADRIVHLEDGKITEGHE